MRRLFVLFMSAKQMSSQNPAWNAPPPSYNQATTGGAFHEAPPNYYNTPGNMYGWMPPAYNFPAPEGNISNTTSYRRFKPFFFPIILPIPF
jgi:hypothetical protein